MKESMQEMEMCVIHHVHACGERQEAASVFTLLILEGVNIPPLYTPSESATASLEAITDGSDGPYYNGDQMSTSKTV